MTNKYILGIWFWYSVLEFSLMSMVVMEEQVLWIYCMDLLRIFLELYMIATVCFRWFTSFVFVLRFVPQKCCFATLVTGSNICGLSLLRRSHTLSCYLYANKYVLIYFGHHFILTNSSSSLVSPILMFYFEEKVVKIIYKFCLYLQKMKVVLIRNELWFLMQGLILIRNVHSLEMYRLGAGF